MAGNKQNWSKLQGWNICLLNTVSASTVLLPYTGTDQTMFRKCLRFHHKIVDIIYVSMCTTNIHIIISPYLVLWTCLDHIWLYLTLSDHSNKTRQKTHIQILTKNNPQNLQLTRAPTTSLGPQFRMTLGNRLESCCSLCQLVLSLVINWPHLAKFWVSGGHHLASPESHSIDQGKTTNLVI